MNLLEPVSGRQFAKMVGQSEGAVRKAVDRSSIINGVTADKKYIPQIAAAEWGKPILPEFLKLEQAAIKPKVKKTVAPPKAKKEKPEAQTADQVVAEVMSEKLPQVSKKDAENIDDQTEEEDTPDTIQKTEAERQAAILKVKILRLAYLEKRAMVVSKDKIDAVLFAFGAELRVAIEGITNRAIDNILAVSDDRAKAKRVLDEEIYNTLNNVSNSETLIF
jgi:hypothetical protein